MLADDHNGWHDGQTYGNSPDGSGWMMFPDYCADLNAMHIAEKILTARELYHYKDELVDVCGDGSPICAPAEVRAEAFLRTLGMWEEDSSTANAKGQGRRTDDAATKDGETKPFAGPSC